MWSAPMRSTSPSASSTARTCGLTRARRSATPSASASAWISASFAAPWESTKLTPSRSSTSARAARPSSASSRTRSSSASAVAKNRPPSKRSTDDARERLVAGVLVEVAEHLRAGLATEQRHRRPRRDVDEPAEREDDADHHAREHAGREHAEDRGHRDPEVEARHAVKAAQLGDVDHPEHDRVDDDGAEDRLREVGEQRREHEQRRRARAPRWRATRPASARPPTRSASWPRGWSRRASPGTRRRRRSPSPGRRTPG